jgi:hypothetical protein
MKVGRIELTQEQTLIAMTAAAMAAILLALLIFYAPLIKKLKASHEECVLREKEVLDARGRIKSAGQIPVEKALVTEDDIALAIDELTEHGRSMGINFISLKPGEITDAKEPQYKVLPIDMEIESKDQQFSDFLGELDGLRRSLIKVKSFDLTLGKEGRPGVNARVAVDMYLARGGVGK